MRHVRLVFNGDTAIDESHDGEDIPMASVELQLLAESLYEPGAGVRVPPRIEP